METPILNQFSDVDALSQFVSESGFILPRRVTCATRRQQVAAFKGIALARAMTLMPYDWQTEAADRMPLMDPLQVRKANRDHGN